MKTCVYLKDKGGVHAFDNLINFLKYYLQYRLKLFSVRHPPPSNEKNSEVLLYTVRYTLQKF